MIGWTKSGVGFFFTPAQKDYLYGMCEFLGLMEIGKEFQKAKDKGEEIEPGRLNTVALALSQVGLVEAHTFSGEKEPNPDGGEDIQKNVGADKLWEYHVRAGRVPKMAVVKDYRYNIDVGKSKDGIQRDSWCQIFSQWAVTLAGGDANVFDFSSFKQTKTPKPGDIAYAPSNNQHMGVVISAENGQVTTVDANVGLQSGIEVTTRPVTWWDGGFHDSFPPAAKRKRKRSRSQRLRHRRPDRTRAPRLADPGRPGLGPRAPRFRTRLASMARRR